VCVDLRGCELWHVGSFLSRLSTREGGMFGSLLRYRVVEKR
jgi:hypothetical protein